MKRLFFSQHTDRVVGQYAYCPGSKHTARVSKRAVTDILFSVLLYLDKKQSFGNQNTYWSMVILIRKG